MNQLFDWFQRQFVEYPDTVTAYIRPYWNEVLKPAIREWKLASPQKEGEGRWKYSKRLVREDPSRKRLFRQDYWQYYYDRNKNRILNKSDNWFDTIRKERPHYNPDELTVSQVKDFLRRFRLEILPKLKGQLEHDAHQWMTWLEKGLEAMQTEEGNWQVFTNEYIVARLQDIMDESGFSERDSFRGKE